MHFVLRDNIKIPAIGFGTWQIPAGDIAYQSTLAALAAGYRHLDTALAYGNESDVGRAIRDSNIPRADIFVTTKLPAEIKGYEEAKQTFATSLANLGLTYVDLYLIHAPKPWGESGDGLNYMENNIASWRAFEDLYNQGLVKSIGVSNFLPIHLKPLIKATKIKPMVNQIKIHPGFLPEENIRFCRNKGIIISAYSPLATGRILNNSLLKKLASKYQKTVAQICLRWCYQSKFLPLPKTINKDRMIENINIFDFNLENEDVLLLNNLKIK